MRFKSRYIPFTQQRYLCVPTCLQMIMYRHGIPLQSAEDIGYALGLTVPEDDLRLFSEGKARTGERPSAGWGTQIYKPEFEINKVLRSLDIPLHVDVDTDVTSPQNLRGKLQKVQDADGDALVCFDWGKLWDRDERAGHLSVFDRLDGEDIWIVDPERNSPKHRKVSLQKLYEAIRFHGPKNSAGVWVITKID